MEEQRHRVVRKDLVLEIQISIAKGHYRNAAWNSSGEKHAFRDKKENK